MNVFVNAITLQGPNRQKHLKLSCIKRLTKLLSKIIAPDSNNIIKCMGLIIDTKVL